MSSFKLAGFILDTELPPTETLLLLAMADFCDEHYICWPSKDTLARRARVSKRTVDKYIDRLAGSGWLTVQLHGGRKANTYTLNASKIFTEGARQPCKSCTPGVQAMLHPRGANHVAPEVPIEEPIEQRAEKTPSAPRSKKQPKPTNDHTFFSRWWCFVYAALTDQRYAYSAKDGALVKAMLKEVGNLGDLLFRACAFLDLPEQKRFPRGSPTISGLKHNINSLAGASDDLIDKFIAAGFLPDENTRLKDFSPWTTASKTSESSTTPLFAPTSTSISAP